MLGGGIGQTAELLTVLRLQNGLSPGLSQAERSLTSFNGRVSGVQAGLGHAAGRLKQVGGAVLGLGATFGALGLAGGLVAATNSAERFQQEMTKVQSQTGGTATEVAAMSKGLLQLATVVPIGPEALALGLYHVESAGYRGAKALEILRTAALAAAVGGSDLEQTTNAIVGAMQARIKGAENLARTAGTINAIVGSGNMRMQDFVASLSSGILAASRTWGVSLGSIGSALATLTDEAVPAQEASTRLRMTLSLLGAPSSKAAKELKQIGIGQLDLANAMRGNGGIVDAVRLLRDHMVAAGLIDSSGKPSAQGAQLLSRAFGGGRSSATIMTLVGNMGLLDQKWKAVQKGANGFGDSVDAASKTAAWKFAQLRAALGSLGIQLGNVLLPVFTDIAQAISQWISDPANRDSLVGGLQAAVGIARMLAGAFMQVAGVAGKIWGSIPGPLQQLLVGGFVAQKTSKWLFGSGPLDWIQGALRGGLRGGLGGALSAAGATPVYVVNMPPGGLGGGGLGGPGAGGGWSALGLGLSAAGGLAIAGAVKATVIDPALSKQNDQITASVAALINNPSTTRQMLQQAIAATQQGASDIRGQAFGLGGTLWGGQADQLDRDTKALQQALMALPLARNNRDQLTPDKVKAAVKEGNRDVASRTDIHQMHMAVTQAERQTAQNIMAALRATGNAITGTDRSGFSAVVAAVGAIAGAIGGLPAYFGTAAQQGRGTGPGGRTRVPVGPSGAPVGIEHNRHIYIQSSVTPRSNDYASGIQGRYGPTPTRAGAA